MKRLARSGRVVVFDGARALIYRNDATPPALDLKLETSHGQDNPPTREQGTDAPPRTNDSMGRRSAMEAPDYHQMAEDRFAREIAVNLAADYANGAFTQAVIVAPPLALAQFRKAMPPALRAAVVLEIDKDLTKHPPREIALIIGKAREAGAA